MSSHLQPTPRNAPSLFYWVFAGALVFYVGMSTGKRDHLDVLDAWEHHRALKALVQEGLGYTGNPTLASPITSLRYSPYTVALAVLCRQTGLDPYDALSLAAVAGTALLVTGVPYLLGAYGEASCSTAALLMIVGLYGKIPFHSNSLALFDLPFIQVNPSNFSAVFSLFIWGLFARTLNSARSLLTDLTVAILTAVVILNHSLTGLLTLLGLGVMAVASGPEHRWGLSLRLVGIATLALVLCLFWPWYDFLKAVRTKPPAEWLSAMDQGNKGFLTVICLPAIVLGLAAFVEKQRLAVRHFLIIGYGSYLAGAVSYVLPRDLPMVGVFGRLPLAGLIFLQLALGIYASHAGLLSPRAWTGYVRALFRGTPAESSAAALAVVVATGLFFFDLTQQCWWALHDPLLTPYVAKLRGKPSNYHPLRPVFASLLESVGPYDIILSDPHTMWVTPSITGRVVASMYMTEILVPDQERRRQDGLRFFAKETPTSERIEILKRYKVKWIILNPKNERLHELNPEPSLSYVLGDCPVVKKVGDIALLDASAWIACRTP